jgi:hypothetical protein
VADWVSHAIERPWLAGNGKQHLLTTADSQWGFTDVMYSRQFMAIMQLTTWHEKTMHVNCSSMGCSACCMLCYLRVPSLSMWVANLAVENLCRYTVMGRGWSWACDVGHTGTVQGLQHHHQHYDFLSPAEMSGV